MHIVRVLSVNQLDLRFSRKIVRNVNSLGCFGEMMMSTTAVSPDSVTQGYTRSFHALHKKVPRIRHMSGDWYQVNGEIVHRSIVEAETERLKTLARKHRPLETNIVKKLIARLRNL